MRSSVALGLVLGACAARGPMIPGPLGVVRDASTGPVRVEPTAPPPTPSEAPAERPSSRPARGSGLSERLAEQAEKMLGGRVPRDFRDDCSGFVASAAARVDLKLAGGTADLYARAEKLGVLHHRRHPARGDLVFFDRTYDRDGNGRMDDRLTHVGIVLETLPDGVIRVAHRADGAGLSVLRMNLDHPDVPVGPDGEVWNDALRRARNSRDQADTLSGALWTAFATVRDQDQERWVP